MIIKELYDLTSSTIGISTIYFTMQCADVISFSTASHTSANKTNKCLE